MFKEIVFGSGIFLLSNMSFADMNNNCSNNDSLFGGDNNCNDILATTIYDERKLALAPINNFVDLGFRYIPSVTTYLDKAPYKREKTSHNIGSSLGVFGLDLEGRCNFNTSLCKGRFSHKVSFDDIFGGDGYIRTWFEYKQKSEGRYKDSAGFNLGLGRFYISYKWERDKGEEEPDNHIYANVHLFGRDDESSPQVKISGNCSDYGSGFDCKGKLKFSLSF